MIFIHIDNDLKDAMRNKDQVALKAIRAIKSAILLLKSEAVGKEITEDDEIKIINRLVKQRRESYEIYKNKGRDDLASEELGELQVLEKYLPQQLTEEEIRDELKKIIAELSVSDISGIGKVMQTAIKKFGGKADGKLINVITRELLS